MRLLDRLKKWFFKEENVGIINIDDLIQIPGREYFKDDANKLDLIDKYKEEYLRILSQNRLLSSKDLSFDDLEDEMIMNVDLILKLVVSHSDDIYSEIKKSKLDNEIDIYKLKLYLNRIEEMEKDNIARLIALKELEKGKRVPRKSVNALKEKINFLTSNLVIFMVQKRAINNEINIYVSNIVIDNSKKDDADEKLKELVSMASLYINVDDILMIDMKSEIKIALIERRLEIFCYKNIGLKNHLKEKQNIINKAVYSYDYICSEGILRQLDELEKKYEVLIRYGYKIVTDDDLNEFYKLKFDVYTRDIVDKEYLKDPIPNYLIRRFTNRELETYKNILQQKIEKIICGRNDIFNKQFEDSSYFNITLSSAINLLVKYLKDDSDDFDFEDILKDPTAEKLSFILSFDSENGFNKFFNKKLRRSHDIPIGALDSYVFQYEKELPLSTVLRVIHIDALREEIIRVYFKELYQLYHLHLKTITSDSYVMPEGIISIHAHKNTIEEDYFSKKMRKEANGKTIKMPNSLKQISGNLFEGVEIKSIILNDGLEYILDHALDSVKDNGLIPPKSLLYADPQVLAKLPNGAFQLFLEVLQENEALARSKMPKHDKTQKEKRMIYK